MNIKISIKDCDCVQGITNNRELSEVQHKKRTMLYAPPQNDRNNKQTVRQQSNNQGAPSNTNARKTNVNMNSKQYRQSQKQMLNQLKKNGNRLDQATYNMIQNSNTVLQRQNQIIEQNQKALHQIVNGNGNTNKNSSNGGIDGEAIKNQISAALDQIKNQVIEIKKMKNQIVSVAQQFNKNATDAKNNRSIPNQVSDLNSNMRNLVQISQNHIQGLQNMEALKSLQNFNIEGYTQAISTLKKQIAQYQKQSQNIERQLKIRSAKLQKLQLPPKFEQQLYRPYQEHLNNRIKNIDLHGIRDRVYQKIGGFDYGKFQNDVNSIMGEARGQLGNFSIICKQFQIVVPEIRIDKADLKNLDMKLPSVLDQYKAVKGIKFEDQKKQTISSQPQSQPSRPTGGLSKTAQIQARLKQTGFSSKKPQNLQGFASKPIDLAHQTQFKKQSDKRPTILQNEQKKQKRQHDERMKKSSKQKKQQNQQFNKYLENRAREQLELLYKQKKESLQRMQKQLHEQIQNPIFIDLNLNRQKVQPNKISINTNKQQPKKKQQQEKQQQQQQQYNEQFEASSQKQKEPGKQIIQEQPSKDPQYADIKQIGRQILKQKLKNILGEKNKPQQHIVRPSNFMPNQQQNINVNGERQMLNIAQGFMNMINNTLTQVNNNLAKSIEKKMERSPDARPRSIQRRQVRKIQVPKLEAFRPPPVFNMNLVQQPAMMPSFIPMPVPAQRPVQVPKKIVVEDYDQYRLKNEDNYEDYQISSDEDDDV